MHENIAPTKANLMSSKAALDFSQKGYELLDKKRNVLIREMMGFMDRAEKLQQIIDETFKEAYEALIMANVTLGITEVYEVAKSIPTADETTMLTRSVMGVEIPMIKYEKQDIQHYYSFYHTNTALDVALQKFHEVKYLI